MRFVEAARRRGMLAVAVTLVVPGVAAIAVATALLGGGFRELGAVTQLVTGPEVPTTALGAERVRAEAPRPLLPAVPLVGPDEGTAGTPGVVPVAAPRGGPRSGGPVAGAPAPAVTRPGPAPAPVVAPTPAAPPGGEPPPPPRPRNPVREAGEAAAGTVGTLPAPVGAAGQDAVTTVLDLVVPAAQRRAQRVLAP
jgi:hypothetical protein